MSRLTMYGVPIDFQRSRVYRSEIRTLALFGLVKEEPDEDLRSIREIEGLVNHLIHEDWWSMNPHFTSPLWIQVKDGRGRTATASFRRREIRMPVWTRQRWYVCHELAHIACPADSRHSAHGPRFAAAYAYIVRHAIGPSVGGALLDGFARDNVKTGWWREVEESRAKRRMT